MTADPIATPAPSTREFYVFIAGRFLINTAMMVQSVAVGWQIYDVTESALALGYVGLAQFLPMLALVLPGGDAADRFDRRKILVATSLLQAVTAGLLLVLTFMKPESAWPFYGVLVLFGVARAFASPAGASIVPLLVPREDLPRAIALSSSAFQTAMIAGPAIGGIVYLWGPAATYAFCCILCLLGAGAMVLIRVRMIIHADEGGTLARLAAGIDYMRRNPIVLGTITLDLFAVLLGGTTALLPIYARDILHAGPDGLGLLRSAPAIGALIVALALVRWPLNRHAGIAMLACVALFGVATIVFGYSENFALSLLALTVLGGADMVSVNVRSTLIQLATPDAMRGRVSGVNFLFISTSNELGEFRAGVMAGWLGAVTAVVVGGIGTLAVVGLCAGLFPRLRKVDRLSDVTPQ